MTYADPSDARVRFTFAAISPARRSLIMVLPAGKYIPTRRF